MAFSVQLRVRYVECDMQGHVFNGHYLTWFDLAHTELLRAATGLAYDQLVARHGFDVVVAESNVRYRAPARLRRRADDRGRARSPRRRRR